MYSLVTRFPCHPTDVKLTTFPLFEAFTTSHTTQNIIMILLTVIHSLQRLTNRKLYTIFYQVISDFSMAGINALIRAFNSMDVITYLKHCWEFIEKWIEDPTTTVDFVIIRLCSSHISKAAYNDINLAFPNKQDKDRYICKKVIKALFDFRVLNDIYSMLKLLWKVLTETDSELKLTLYKKTQSFD